MDPTVIYERIVKLKTRYATTLFLFSIAFIISAFALNSTISSNNQQQQRSDALQKSTSKQLYRYDKFIHKSPRLYESLILTLVKDRCSNIFNAYRDEGHYGKSSPLIDSVEIQSKRFSQTAYPILSMEDTTGKITKLAILADEIFTDTCLKIYVKANLSRLVTINTYDIAYWIVFDFWPAPSVVGANLREDVSYLNRFDDPYNKKEWKENGYLVTSLSMELEDSSGETLKEAWKTHFKQSQDLTTPTLKISALGMEIAVEDILIITGPVLFFWQILFFLYCMRERAFLIKNPSVTKEFVFPDFSFTNEEYTLSHGNNLILLVRNIVFYTFLSLPTIILFFGFFTRYDIATDLRYAYPGDSLLTTLIDTKASDFSIVIDLVHLICLSFTLLFSLYLTKQNPCEELKLLFKPIHAIIVTVVLMIATIALFCFLLHRSQTFIYSLIIVQYMMWIYFFILAWINKSGFVLFTCIGALAINCALCTL